MDTMEKTEEEDADRLFLLSCLPLLKKAPTDLNTEARVAVMQVLQNFCRPIPMQRQQQQEQQHFNQQHQQHQQDQQLQSHHGYVSMMNL